MINNLPGMKRFIMPLFVLFFVLSCGNGSKQAGTGNNRLFRQVIDMDAGSALANARDSIDFGRMKQGEVAEYTLGIRNADTAAMVILDILNGCGCTALEYDKSPVMPGDTAAITLRYDSKGQFGTQLKLIQIVTSFSQKPHNVRIMADVTDAR